MNPAPAQPPHLPAVGEWQPLPAPGTVTPTSQSAKPLTQRVRAAALWLRDTFLGGFGFALVLVVALAGWAASFIGLHDFGVNHMGLSEQTAWLVPITFDGAPAGLSIVVARASTHGRPALLWRVLIVGFTGLSSWINYMHITDDLGRLVAAFMPPSAVILFEGLMSEARAAAIRRMGRERPRLHLLRWVFDFTGTLAIYRSYILGIELPEQYRQAAETETGETETSPAAQSPETSPRVETETGETVRETDADKSPETDTETAGETKSETTQPRGTETNRRRRDRKPRETKTETARQVSSISDIETETRALVGLMRSRRGADKVSLDDAIRETGRPKSTAAKRLKAARETYAKQTETDGGETGETDRPTGTEN